jgi:hypothetical protein
MAVGVAVMAGSAVLGGAASYFQAQAAFKQAQENNRQARIAGDREQALNTVNINRAKESHLANTINIDTARMQSRSQAIVAAAAAGTSGMSIDDSILDIERNAAKSEFNSSEKLNSTIFSLEENRSAIEARVRSRTILQAKPSVALAAFSTALNAGDKYYAAQGYGV